MKKLWKWIPLLALTLVIVCLVHQPAQAMKHEDFSYVFYNKPSYTEGDYTYVVEDGEAFIVGVDKTISGHVQIPSSLGGYPVAFVYGGTFRGCTGITEATFPDSVVTIGFNCFENCTNLKTVNIGKNVKTLIGRAFAGCTSLTTVNWGPGVEKIGRENFYNCTGLTSMTIPDTVTEIDTKMFYNCKNLETIELSKNLTVIPQQTFEKCEKLKACMIPDGVEAVGRYVFKDCTSLESVVIGSSVKNIEMYAFSGCTSLTTVAMNSCVELIGEYAFQNCEKLQAITIPDTTTDIGDYAFSGCESMTTATIGNSVQRIGVSAFKGCKALMGIEIPDSVTLIERYAFSGCSAMKTAKIGENVEKIDFGGFEHCAALEEIVIPDSVTSISDGVFKGCSGAKKVMIGKGVTALPEKAFYGCAALETITIPKNVTSIGNQVFTECSGMQTYTVAEDSEYFSNDSRGVLLNKAQTVLIQAPGSISGKYVMPETVITLGDYAFFECGKLTEIVFADGVKHIGNQCFLYCSNLEHVDYGESLETAGSFCFGYCEKLTEINLPATFKTISGLMYNGCNGLVHVVLPDSVEVIGPEAFGFCNNLKTIDLGNGIREIQKSAFQHCGNLTAITAGENLALIADMAFNYCDDLKDVYFRGTNAQWCDVEIVNYYPGNYNGYLINAQLHLLGEHEHKYSKYVKDNNATCTTDGTETATCSICGDRKTRAIEGTALGHTGGTATCASPAICTRCGEPYGAADESKHSGTTVVSTQGVSYTQMGYTEYRCDHCGGTFLGDIVKPKGLPKPAVTVTTDPATGNSILTWADDGEAHYYAVYRATSSKGKYSLYTTVEEPTAVLNIAIGKTYYFKVRACTEAEPELDSAYSDYLKLVGKCAQTTAEISNDASGYPVIKWQKVSGAKKYEVWYATSETGTYKKLTSTSSSSYTYKKAKVDTTYFFKVRAYGSSTSSAGAYSNVVSGLRKLAKPGITVTPNYDEASVKLTWKKVSSAKSYQLQCSVNGGDFATIATLSGTSYTHKELVVGNTYTYRLSALGNNAAAASDYSTEKTATMKCGRPAISFSFTAEGKPVLNWTPVAGAASYEIQVSTKSKSGYKTLAVVETDGVIHEAAVSGKTYYYKVRAIAADGVAGDYCSYKSAVAKFCAPVITEVTTDSKGYPVVKWQKVSGAKKYEVWYATSETGTYKKLTSTSSASYTYKKAKMDVDYYFKVRAYGSSTSSAGEYSLIVVGWRKLAQPSLSLSVSQSGKITAKWKKVTGAVGYELQCSVNGGEYTTVYAGTALSFVHTELAPGNRYTYRVRALANQEKASGDYGSAKSGTIQVGKPTVSITLSEGGKPQLTWEAVEGAVTYKVYYATSKSGKYKLVETTESLTAVYEAAKAGKTAYFKVCAVDINGTAGDYSSKISIKSK